MTGRRAESTAVAEIGMANPNLFEGTFEIVKKISQVTAGDTVAGKIPASYIQHATG